MASRSSESVSFEQRDEENQRLREENARLRRVLAAHGITVPELVPDDARPVPTITPAAVENKEERARKRIALFRSLFCGREDVYARRWENPDGRSGYSPAALKDWKAINSSRVEDRKKVDRNTRKFLPLSDVVIENHLLGKETVGIYPLLPDETCWFLAVDFDKKTRTDDARAFLDTCQELNVPAALERSRSGNGGHVWIFFEHAIPANTATLVSFLGLPADPTWAHEILTVVERKKRIEQLDGIGCEPVLISATTEEMLEWIGDGLRSRALALPEGNGSVIWPRYSIAAALNPLHADA